MPMALAQTSDGYLWEGGASGLYRFDGVHFEKFEATSATKLPGKAIIHLLALPDGKLWVGFSLGGLSVIDKGKVTNYNRVDGLPPNEIMFPVQDQDGRMWVATDNGLARFDGKQWERIGNSWNCPPKSADSIFVDSRGTIWVGINQTILYLPKGSHHFEQTGDFVEQAYQFAEAADGKVWVADAGEGVRPVGMPGSTRSTIARCMAARAKAGLPHEQCHGESQTEIKLQSGGLLFDRDGGLWMTTLGDGLLRAPSPAGLGTHQIVRKSVVEGKDVQVERFTAKEGLSSDYTVPILQDREGNIWVGSRDGLDQFRKTPITPVALPSGTKDFSLTASDNGFMWVSNEMSITRIHGGESGAKTLSIDGLSASYPLNETRYFFARNGLYKLSDRHIRKVAPNPANLIGEVDRPFTFDRKGRLWVMVEREGLFFLNGNHWVRFPTPPDIRNASPLTAYTDPMGRLWFGFLNNLLVKFEDSKFELFGRSNGLILSPEAIFGRDQHLWIGGTGLLLFEGGKFRTVWAPAQGPYPHGISGIIESPGHGLWMTTGTGVAHIPETEMRKVLNDPAYVPQEERFNSQDGVPGTGQSSPPFPSAKEGSDGRIWFAAARGVAWIDPSSILIKSIPPPVVINTFLADNRPQLTGTVLRVPSRTVDYQISYTALSLSIPERVRFRYRLDGLDHSWQDAGVRREAYFSQLRPGHYTFHVIACNGDGVWNETGASLGFYVIPTFFQTAWFTLFCVLCCLVLLAIAYSLRIRYVTAQIQKSVGARMEERERIARELHDTLLQGFQGLMLRFQAVMKTLPPDQPSRRMMEQVLDRADDVLLEGRQSVRDLREKGSSGIELADALSSCGAELALGHPSLLRMTLVGTPQPLETVVFDEAYRISREALINAFQHAKASRIEVELTYSGSALSLRIRDDGAGIEADVVSRGREGHWGMSGMRERAHKIGAKINIWSSPGVGTEIALDIPAAVAFASPNRERLWQHMKRIVRKSKETTP